MLEKQRQYLQSENDILRDEVNNLNYNCKTLTEEL
jgi:cell division protein FtsB